MCQYIRMHQGWDSNEFHCPACGAEVFTAGGEPTAKPCEHLLFSFCDTDFFNVTDNLKSFVDDEENYLFPSDKEFQEVCPDNCVLFALESHGFACGPVSFTVIHAIDFPE